VIFVTAPGLRVELCWETPLVDDIDLHLLSVPDRQNPPNFCDGERDCFYGNCQAQNFGVASWGLADSDLSACRQTTRGEIWETTFGVCKNPRLDIDNVGVSTSPENINVDFPRDGDLFRVMVHHFGHGGSVEPHPVVNIYCDGARLATFGQAPDYVEDFLSSGYGCGGASWRVADVTTRVLGAATNCEISALTGPGGGYDVRHDSSAF
jgi:hypothetical protein